MLLVIPADRHGESADCPGPQCGSQTSNARSGGSVWQVQPQAILPRSTYLFPDAFSSVELPASLSPRRLLWLVTSDLLKYTWLGAASPLPTAPSNLSRPLTLQLNSRFSKQIYIYSRTLTACAPRSPPKRRKLNLLFMIPGYMTLKGRDETAKGLDRKFSLHYYARMRIITQLLPLLKAAAEDTSVEVSARLSRVASVLDPHASVHAGGAGTLDYSDISLKNTFTLAKCAAHASLISNFFLKGMARKHPLISFVHAYPSGVATGLMREIPGGKVLAVALKTLLRPFMVLIEESG